jgi:hypothetical protein
MDSKVSLRFLVPLRPISVNKMYRVFRGRSIKSKEGRIFEDTFNHYLAEFASYAIDFLNDFDPYQDAVHVDVISYIRKEDFFTKDGRIHKRCLDVDNALKCVLDQVFAFIGLDDGLMTRVSSEKVPSDSDSVEIRLTKVSAPNAIRRPIKKANFGGESLQ